MGSAGQLASGVVETIARAAAAELRRAERGYAMAALLVGMSVMAVLMSAALPAWSHLAQRENEAELVWRGEQYARAIGLFQRKYANTFPPTVDVLVEQKFLRKKYKDPITNDDFQIIPVGGAMPGQLAGGLGGGAVAGAPGTRPAAAAAAGAAGTSGGGFGQQPTGASVQQGTQPGSGGLGQQRPPLGVQGVTSKSKDTSLRLYNGMDKYNQWAFVYVAVSAVGGVAGGGPGGTPNLPPGINPANPFRPNGDGAFGTPTQPGGAPPIFSPGGAGQPRMPPVGGGSPGPFGTPTLPGKPKQ